MRTYLVVMDESREAQAALRFSARRAARTGGGVEILSVIEQQDFVEWGGVQAAIEEEARLRAEAAVAAAASTIVEEAGLRPVVTVRQGSAVKALTERLKEGDEIAALVLGAAAEGAPGPLITHFTTNSSALPCPLMIVPGHLDDETLDRLT